MTSHSLNSLNNFKLDYNCTYNTKARTTINIYTQFYCLAKIPETLKFTRRIAKQCIPKNNRIGFLTVQKKRLVGHELYVQCTCTIFE